jgi:hypothetical protein
MVPLAVGFDLDYTLWDQDAFACFDHTEFRQAAFYCVE